jgi:hypothetical protein
MSQRCDRRVWVSDVNVNKYVVDGFCEMLALIIRKRLLRIVVILQLMDGKRFWFTTAILAFVALTLLMSPGTRERLRVGIGSAVSSIEFTAFECALANGGSSAGRGPVSIIRANTGGHADVAVVPGPVCMSGRTIYAHVTLPVGIDVGSRREPVSVQSFADLPSAAANSTARRKDLRGNLRAALVIDVCPSVYHILADAVPALLGFLQSGKLQPSGVSAAASDGLPQLPATVVIRSNCHVFHLGALLFVLPFAMSEPLVFTRDTLTDSALVRALKGHVLVMPPAADTSLRLADADFESVERRSLILDEDELACACGAVVAGETGSSIAPSEMQRVLTTRLDAILPLSDDVAMLMWAGCNARQQYRVLVMLRRHSRLLGRPKQLMHSLRRHKALCARVFYFDELPVIQQYFAARSAHAVVGQHGAGLTFLNVMVGPPLATPLTTCRRALLELWFFGRHSKSLSVYERVAGVAQMSYQLLLPSTADFFDYIDRPSLRNTQNNSWLRPEDVNDVVLPRNAVLERHRAQITARGKAIKKLASPHFAKDFLQQIAYFDRQQIDTAVDHLVRDLRTDCPLL